ncbi:arrestin domain protein [Penicillium lividum]|nr:arrestin domain protein [Penicillium lividum]
MESVAERNVVEGAILSLDPFRRSTNSTPESAFPDLRNERVVASAKGIMVAFSLAEPIVYLPQFLSPCQVSHVEGNFAAHIDKGYEYK